MAKEESNPNVPSTAHSQKHQLAHIRHELRTPINHIIGYSEMLHEEVAESGQAEFLEDLEKIQRGGRRLLELINEYFDPVKFTGKKWDPHLVLHELRTPVNHIIGYSELLQDQAADSGQSSLIADLEKIHTAATHWLCLMEGYLIPSDKPIHPFAPPARGTIDERIETRSPAHEPTPSPLPGEEPATGASNEAPLLGGAGGGFMADAQVPLQKPASPEEHPNLPRSAETPREPMPASDTELILRHAPAKDRVASAPQHGRLLVVDDDATNRDMLARRLQRQGYEVSIAENGQQALEMVRARKFDLVLLDMIMPGIDGYQVLQSLKGDETLRHVPVLMISALDDIDGIVRCIEIGAEDYIAKPFNPVFLRARIGAALEKKRLRDQEQIYLKRIQEEQEKAERLLLNILPLPIAERLKDGEQGIADSFAEVTVLFGDLVGFTSLSVQILPAEMIKLLNEVFSAFDQLAGRHGLEKIKTIGDAYMAVSGLPTPRPDHAEAAAEMALDMQEEIERFNRHCGTSLQMRIGMNTGPVIAGIIGTRKFTYDLWGDTVNTASRMESHGKAGHIQVTQATFEKIRNRYGFVARGSIDVKGKGPMPSYWLTGRI